MLPMIDELVIELLYLRSWRKYSQCEPFIHPFDTIESLHDCLKGSTTVSTFSESPQLG